jgi:hypothetical protein
MNALKQSASQLIKQKQIQKTSDDDDKDMKPDAQPGGIEVVVSAEEAKKLEEGEFQVKAVVKKRSDGSAVLSLKL